MVANPAQPGSGVPCRPVFRFPNCRDHHHEAGANGGACPSENVEAPAPTDGLGAALPPRARNRVLHRPGPGFPDGALALQEGQYESVSFGGSVSLRERGGVLMFDPEAFVVACQAAASADDPLSAVQEVVGANVRDGSAIDAVLGTKIKREHDTFFSSEDLTVQRILWPGGSWSPPHDHRMWAVIGVYVGEEVNRLFERAPDGLREVRTCAVSEQEVFALGPDAIHSVENPYRGLTGGLHVYGGDIVGIDRSAWSPDGREVPFSENSSQHMSMFQVIRDLATERGEALDPDARYEVLQALKTACRRERRYLTPDEARQTAERALNTPH